MDWTLFPVDIAADATLIYRPCSSQGLAGSLVATPAVIALIGTKFIANKINNLFCFCMKTNLADISI